MTPGTRVRTPCGHIGTVTAIDTHDRVHIRYDERPPQPTDGEVGRKKTEGGAEVLLKRNLLREIR